MTKLEAINSMLRSVQAMDIAALPETSPETPISYEAQVAIDIFNRVNKQVQIEGYSFNTRVYEISPDTNGYIWLPSNTLRADATDPTKDYIVREGKLYDLKENTYVFKQPVEISVVEEVPFENLPVPAQELVLVLATRKYQTQIYGSEILNQFTLQEERDARIQLKVYEARTRDANVLRNVEIMRAFRR